MKIALRGHIRDSFNDKRLYNLLKDIRDICGNIQIYIHTWDIVQSSLSWRKMAQNDTKVTEELIRTYFNDISEDIVIILIDDDKTIPLIGNIAGKLLRTTNTPLISWKRYWFGKYRIFMHLYNSCDTTEETVVNMRFDVLSNSNPVKSAEIVKFINDNLTVKFTRNKFIRNTNCSGIDNIYG
jgi:hypothetical protein